MSSTLHNFIDGPDIEPQIRRCKLHFTASPITKGPLIKSKCGTEIIFPTSINIIKGT